MAVFQTSVKMRHSLVSRPKNDLTVYNDRQISLIDQTGKKTIIKAENIKNIELRGVSAKLIIADQMTLKFNFKNRATAQQWLAIMN